MAEFADGGNQSAKRQCMDPCGGQLHGKVAVITGSGIGVGRAIAERFAAEGAKVVVADFNEKLGSETLAFIEAAGGTAFFQHTDVTKEESIEACMNAAKTAYGTIHILVNNAVQFVFGHLLGKGNGSGTGTDREITDEDWARVMNAGPIGAAKCTKHAVKIMLENKVTGPIYSNDQGQGVTQINAGSRGNIVNILSISSFIAQPEFIPYNMSKGAGMQLMRCSAKDLAPKKIRVNALCPGTTETPGSYNHMRLLGMTVEEGRKAFAQGNLMQRQAAPAEIANGALFLASDQSSFMTGAQITVDGGETLK